MNIHTSARPSTARAHCSPRTLIEQVMSMTMLQKFHDPMLAIADKLTSQNGSKSIGNTASLHDLLVGVDSNRACVQLLVVPSCEYTLVSCLAEWS